MTNVRQYKILSASRQSDATIGQIISILKQSQCPNESLRNSFERYHGINGDEIYFDDPPRNCEQKIEIVDELPSSIGVIGMNIIHPYLKFGELSERPFTDMIVIHHTGERDIDASAQDIHRWHLDNGWAGIGYHYVIRKNGDIEIGRPEWATGSHAFGENYHTIGIHLSGDFETAYPTAEQINACAELIADICGDYGMVPSRANIVGHCDLMDTDCPGKNLYSKLDEIVDRALACYNDM